MSLRRSGSNAAAVPAAGSAFRCVRIDVARDQRWDEFLRSQPDATVYHHSLWLRAIAAEYGQELIALACEDAAGRIHGVLPLLSTRGMPWFLGHRTARRLSSLPRTPLGGPVGQSPLALRTLVQAAMRIVQEDGGGRLLEIKSLRDDLAVPGLAAVPWRFTYVVDLPSDHTQLRFGNSRQRHQMDWAARRAARHGVEVREADERFDLAQWYRLYLETMRHHAIPARSLRFFEYLWSRLRPAGLLRLLVAEQVPGRTTRLLAGSMFLSFSRTVFYAFNGRSTADLPLHANDAIQWRVLREACLDGFRHYDLGEVNDECASLAAFKRKWGGRPRRMYRYYSAPRRSGEITEIETSSAHRLLRPLWRCLPLAVTALLGDRIYRFL